jgi:hypothetical protein
MRTQEQAEPGHKGPRIIEMSRVRQGEARYVLAIGTVLVVVAFAVIYFVSV